MTQQINLFNPALKIKRNRLTARNLTVAAGVVLIALMAFVLLAGLQNDQLQTEARDLEAKLKNDQAQLAALTKQLAEQKPDARLAADLAQAEQALAGRKEIIATLQSGAIGRTEGFSEHMRAFARQTVNGLWLTGFSISSGGNEMEIRGRTQNAELVPAYIRRLNGEKALNGRSFAALDMRGVVEEPVVRPAADPAARSAAEPVKPAVRYIEFNLMSAEPVGERKP